MDFKTAHRVVHEDARKLESVPNASIDLVVTSPPYPMIAMWDPVFAGMAPEITQQLAANEGVGAWDRMHQELHKVWEQCVRVLKPGAIACINIGDATRTLDGEFRLFPNHARVLQDAAALGLTSLPDILWRKPTNAPNKFLGSGMLPAGAYVTYEHEYVLIFRKGRKREFSSEESRELRRRSAYFWEERNQWFSDVWMDLPGVGQGLTDAETRRRSGAFPLELPFRLIQMHSVLGDTVLDPFAGTGTTLAAAAASGRSSVGVELDPNLGPAIGKTLEATPGLAAKRQRERLVEHRSFVAARQRAGRSLKHHNARYDTPVITAQEKDLHLLWPKQMGEIREGLYEAAYDLESRPEETKQQEFPLTEAPPSR